MKALSKPLSSPSRAEKFPPPLMRFLRSNVGSRSRGRSRSSPMFYLRSKKSGPGVVQEPSSPKVTCIGQVRVRRSAKSEGKRPGGTSVKRRRLPCRWLKRTLFCGSISPRFRSQRRPFRGIFCKWGLFFRSGFCQEVDAAEDNKNCNNEKIAASDCTSKSENLGGEAQENKRGFLESSSSPPKNALILTRCRSAPYRSSSLGGRFWGSPINEGKPEEPRSEDAVEEPNISLMTGKEMENPLKNGEDLKGSAGGAVHPLLLTRCKSEPARTGERLNPEASFLRQKRSDVVVEPCSQCNP